MKIKPIFDPVNRTLHDSRGKLLKRVDCPRLKSWQHLDILNGDGAQQRYCDSCDKAVLDTDEMTSDEMVRVVEADPNVCFRIRLGQKNIEIKVANG